MELGLEGKSAIVTGASKGIGKAIMESLKKEGVYVYNMSRTTGYDLIKKIPEELESHILINNVGGGGTWSNFKECIDKNYGIMLDMTTNYLKSHRDWGRVITIASIYGKEKGPNPGFTAAKAAQIAYMKSMAGKVEGTTFNTVCPGYIDVGKPFNLDIPYPSTVGKPEDVANLVTYLCSPKANHIDGACITVDGGCTHSW